MRTFGFALAAVLCAAQLTVALPRPDFGISIEVFSSDRTDAVASGVSALLAELWNTNPLDLTSTYDTLINLVDEINFIGMDFSEKVETLFNTISDLANADADVSGSFGAVTSAIDVLETYIGTDVSTKFGNIDNLLANNEIVTMLQDAFDEVSNTLSDLSEALGNLEADINDVVSEAGNGPITKSLLRSFLRPTQTTAVTIRVEQLKADLPLVFYILMKTKDLIKMADDYIIEGGDVAASAVEYIDEGLAALADEVDSYSQATSVIKAIVDDVSTPNLDFTGLDLSVIAEIQIEANHFGDTYGEYLEEAITAMTEHYGDYQAAIPGVSDGYSDFYVNACDHIYDIVTVLINFGPYAEYCFEKYGDQGLALFEQNARRANECVDREITRLLKLQEFLERVAETMVFSVEDLLETITVCVENADYCNASDIDTYLMDLHLAVEDHLSVLEDIVDYETEAGLARLQACFTASKYGILAEISDLQDDLASCEQSGPN